jgi:ABC-type sugar transport system permease subunit
MNLFTEPFVMTNNLKGGTDNQGLTVMMYLLDKAPYGNNQYGYASAFAYILCAIIVILSVVNMRLFEDREDKRGAL